MPTAVRALKGTTWAHVEFPEMPAGFFGIRRGEQHYLSKLTDVEVQQMRERYAVGRVTQDQLAEEHGLSGATVYRILHGVIWTHVGGPVVPEGRKIQNMPRGEMHCRAKVTAQDVRAIRNDYSTGEISLTALACKFGIGTSQVFRIVRRESWKHLE